MRELRVPGVAIGLMYEGEEHAAGLGVTNLEHPLAVDDQTLFQIGSITKTFVGTAAMRLVEDGMLDLDAPLRTVLPELRLADENVAARVTLRHVLTHTGGWAGDYFEDFGPGDDALARMVARLETLPQITPLGEVSSYSNSGFYLAGRVIEAAAGQTLEAALRELVIVPLGLTMTFFRHWAHEFITHRVAAGHVVPEESDAPLQVARPYARSRSGCPTGGIVSTIRDVLRYARFHLGDGRAADGTRLLTAESMRRMQEPLVRTSYLGTMRGLTWGIYATQGVKRVGHEGATLGQQALLSLAPARGFALAVLTNSNRGAALAGRVRLVALERYLGVRPEKTMAPDISIVLLRDYAGTYRGHGAGPAVEVSVADDGAVLLRITERVGITDQPAHQRPTARAEVAAEDALQVTEGWDKGNVVEFLRDSAGAVKWLRYAGRVLERA